jgi:hypothetical protein
MAQTFEKIKILARPSASSSPRCASFLWRPHLLNAHRFSVSTSRASGLRQTQNSEIETIMKDNPLLANGDDPLRSLEKKLQVVRDLVTGVVMGFKTGFFLYGSGGVGKSYTVLHHLKYLDAGYQLYNSRMTAKGLFLALQHNPDAVHVLEDMERITKDADAQGVLRSALWAQPGHDRVVTWTTAVDGAQRFAFRGGLILISNRQLADLPELRALATRIEVHRLEVTEAELTAKMRELAGQGFRRDGKVLLESEKCFQVTEHLLRECRAAACPLDLRLQQKSFQTYLQWQAEYSSTDWRDLMAASVREATHHFRHEVNPLPREARRTQRRIVLRAILSQTKDPKEQEQLYEQQTGASRADFYRRKFELETGEFDECDAK